jgi:hypothetical protein
MSGGYGISEWPDIDALYRRFDALVRQPMRPLRRDGLDQVMKYFDERCVGSKKLADEAKRFIPGGVQHNLAFNHPFPLAMARAEGAYLTDVDGNRYTDFLQAGGPTLLGSNHPAVRAAVEKTLDESGPVTGLLHESELRLAELVNRFMPACTRLHPSQVDRQGRRRLSRLERPARLRHAPAGHRPHGGGRHPARLDRLDAGSQSQRSRRAAA